MTQPPVEKPSQPAGPVTQAKMPAVHKNVLQVPIISKTQIVLSIMVLAFLAATLGTFVWIGLRSKSYPRYLQLYVEWKGCNAKPPGCAVLPEFWQPAQALCQAEYPVPPLAKFICGNETNPSGFMWSVIAPLEALFSPGRGT